jgi:KGK domain
MEFKPLEDGETAISIPSNMFKHKELIDFINEAFRHGGLNRLGEIIWDRGRGKIPLEKEGGRRSWFEDGIKCEILKPNSTGWQQGRVRINVTIEFCADEQEGEESALNSIRQSQSIQ